MNSSLSIGIPTYNRKEQLQDQLRSLFRQDLSKIQEIIIVDNHSQYDVQAVLSEFDPEKIRLITNPLNIGMSANMESPFLYCNSEWLWMLSDDDETIENSISDIFSEINKSQQDTGMIKFSIQREGSILNNKTVTNLKDYIDYYYNEKNIQRGELVFISTNVYNINNLRNYLGYAFEFAYTYIGFLMPVIMGLNDESISVRFSDKPIVKYNPPREGNYSFAKVGKGLSTLSHLPLNLDEKYWKRFLNCTMSIPYMTVIRKYLNNDKVDSLRDIKIIYNNIYKYYLPCKSKIIVHLFFIAMSYKVTNRAVYGLLKIKSKI